MALGDFTGGTDDWVTYIAVAVAIYLIRLILTMVFS